MGLVDYSDSEEEQPRLTDDCSDVSPRPAKCRKRSLPPLPTNFGDLYTSTVRTSTQDDPHLHGGRKRITPHVAGHWPTHVFLEWRPNVEEIKLLRKIVMRQRERDEVQNDSPSEVEVHSLLENDLGVELPLHISLSRSLILKTDQKDTFLQDVIASVISSRIKAFKVTPSDVIWHPNEDRSRWFLVVQLERPPGDELRELLGHMNAISKQYSQPLLYDEAGSKSSKTRDSFHVSIAWSLKAHDSSSVLQNGEDEHVMSDLQKLELTFTNLKVRIGQDVTSVPLQKSRTTTY